MQSQSQKRATVTSQTDLTTSLLSTGGPLGLTVSTANLWNSLLVHLTSAPSLMVFRQRLKTSHFRRSYPDLIISLSEFTVGCRPSSNFLIQATLKVSLMMMI